MATRSAAPKTLQDVDWTPLVPYVKTGLYTFVPIVITWLCYRLLRVVHPAWRQKPPGRRRGTPTRLLVVLGSGGHTAEMFAMLRRIGRAGLADYTHRSYIVSGGDQFSAQWAEQFEAEVMGVPPAKPVPPPGSRTPAGSAQAPAASPAEAVADPDAKTDSKESLGESWLDIAHTRFTETTNSDGTLNPSSPAAAPADAPAAADAATPSTYDITFIPRAREIHQSIYTTPFSAFYSLVSAASALAGPTTVSAAASAAAFFADQTAKFEGSLARAAPGSLHATAAQLKLDELKSAIPSPRSTLPDGVARAAKYGVPSLVLTNGPATGAVVVLGAVVMRVLNWQWADSRGLCRTVFVESWARVTRVSLAGRVASMMADRFVVQWEGLEGSKRQGEYLGWLV